MYLKLLVEEFKHCCKPSEDLIRVGKVLCQRIKSWLAWDEKINSIVQNVSSHCIMGFNNMFEYKQNSSSAICAQLVSDRERG